MQLVITMTAAGQMNVTGPLQNPLLCYGMLELAKDIIRKMSADNEAKMVKVPQIHLNNQ